jgi:hypothetical protein
VASFFTPLPTIPFDASSSNVVFGSEFYYDAENRIKQ